MTELAFAIARTIVRLGEAVPDIPIASAVDFILPVNCRRSTTAVRAASGTAGKMNSSEAEPRHAAPPARAACEGWLWPQQVDQTGVKACRRRAVVARAETAAEEPSAVASQRLLEYLGHQVVLLACSEQGCALVRLCLSMCEVGVRAGGVCG